MINLNTNKSSLIAQSSLTNSTNLINQAIERMTSGAKLNHASDNAANFSISTNMSTKISSYEVAEDNVVMAIDMLNTANSSIDLISDKLARLRSLTVLACNGTYGSSSIKAMNAEAATLINEIYRTRNTTEYNGKNIYGANILNEDTIGAQELEVKSSGFMLDIETRDTSAMTSIASVDETKTLAKGTYSISSADELAKFARMQNAGKITPGSEFVQGADIDLSEYAPGTHFNGWGWTPIGMDTLNYDWNLYWFEGTFDGNGYKISNLNIRYDGVSGYKALFAKAKNSTFKNIAIIDGNINITGKGCVCNGALLGQGQNCTVTNCFSNVNIQNESTPNDKGWQGSCAGLVGALLNGSEISYCYSTGNTKAVGTASGLVHQLTNSHMLNCFATGEIVADYDSNGGLIGKLENSTIENCFATGNVYSKRSSNGGLIGDAFGTNNTILNCHATGKVKAAGTSTGDLIGKINSSLTVENCYATGDIEGTSLTGGLIGCIETSKSLILKNSFSTGNVQGQGMTGGLIGDNRGDVKIDNCYATGSVNGTNSTGGIIGNSSNAITMSSCYSTGSVKGTSYVGGICGHAMNNSSTVLVDSYCSGNVTGSGRSANSLSGNNLTSAKIENCLSAEELKDGVPFSYDKNYSSLQVGIDSGSSSRITMDTSFNLGSLKHILCSGINNRDNLEIIDSLISKISAKQTDFGAVQNRLESALDEISIRYDNLVSSRLTIRDADVADVSSQYIRQQILQQASATLLSTANQSPALALQLI